MALEVIGIEGQVTAGGAARGPATTTGIRNGTAYVAAAQPAGTDTTFQAGDIVVYVHSVENRRASINAPATGNIHSASNHSVKISINGGADSNMVDIGYVRGGNSNRQGSGAWAFTLPTGQTLQDIVVSHVISNQSGSDGNYGRSHRLLVVRGAEADYGNNLALGTVVSNSSTASFPDQDPIEWEQPSSTSWTSTNYNSGVGVIWFASYRRDSTGVDPTQDPGGTITRPTNTDFTGTSAGTGDGGFMTNVTQGRGHAAITYFQMGFLNYAAINGVWANGNTYGFVVADGDTNGGAGLGIFFREASTSTPGTPASLTADYAISVTGSPSTLGSEYAVKDTSGTASLSGLYAVQSTGTPATLSSEYQVAVPDSEDLSSDYAVKVQGDAQSLTSSYAVKVQGSPPSLSSSYDIASAEPGTPATLGSEYSVKSTGNPQEVEADYSVTSTATFANLGGSYGVTSTGDPQTLSSGYAVTAPPNGVSLGAEYTVSVTGDEQEVSSAYAVTSSDEQTLTGSYVISDPDAISLSASYAVQSQGQEQDLTGTYGVTSASEDLPSLSSAYAVTSTGTAQTLDGSYLVSVAGQEADLLSDYAVTSSGTEPELTAGYAVTSIVDVDNSYAIKTSDTLEVSSSYAVTISDTENLSASYALIESKTQEIQASYEITGFTASAPVTELYAEYAVINQDHLGYKAFRQLSILRQRVK